MHEHDDTETRLAWLLAESAVLRARLSIPNPPTLTPGLQLLRDYSAQILGLRLDLWLAARELALPGKR